MSHAVASFFAIEPQAETPVGNAASERAIAPARHACMDDLRARIRRYNCGLDPAGQTFGAALVLVAGVEIGQNVDLLARRCGLDRAFVARCARRLIDNGVWERGRTIADWAPHDPASGTFWNDVAVAEGKMCRRNRPDGSLEWAPAGFWNKNFHFLDPDAEHRLGNLYLDPRPAPETTDGAQAADQTDAMDVTTGASPGEMDGDPASGHQANGASEAAGVTPVPSVASGPADEPDDACVPRDETVPPLHHVFRDAVWIG